MQKEKIVSTRKYLRSQIKFFVENAFNFKEKNANSFENQMACIWIGLWEMVKSLLI